MVSLDARLDRLVLRQFYVTDPGSPLHLDAAMPFLTANGEQIETGVVLQPSRLRQMSRRHSLTTAPAASSNVLAIRTATASFRLHLTSHDSQYSRYPRTFSRGGGHLANSANRANHPVRSSPPSGLNFPPARPKYRDAVVDLQDTTIRGRPDASDRKLPLAVASHLRP
jgi:hypothetical protein